MEQLLVFLCQRIYDAVYWLMCHDIFQSLELDNVFTNQNNFIHSNHVLHAFDFSGS